MRALSKSRFKLGLECPRKLYYSSKKEYSNLKQENDFLLALADGGFQVEELARLHYPNGVLVEEASNDYTFLAQRTAELLKKDNVIIYEAAFLVDELFIRTDILVKYGNHIRLIEVKSKTIDSTSIQLVYYTKSGGIASDWKPYFFDLAFQTYVVRKCLPQCTVNSFFMLADKSKAASRSGLNQLFRVSGKALHRTGINTLVSNLKECGQSVLCEVEVTSEIDSIISGDIKYDKNKTFKQELFKLHNIHVNQIAPPIELNYSKCKKCEFRKRSTDSIELSGVEECLNSKGWSENNSDRPNIFEIWNFPGGKTVLESNRFYLTDITIEDFSKNEATVGMSPRERRWTQVEKSIAKDNTPFIDFTGLKNEMSFWKYPYHLIDFETSTVALPFTEGGKPYEQVAFQFSHHIIHESGIVEHKNQFLCDTPGDFPNYKFVRALKDALNNDNGSIFRFAAHENTILNFIGRQLNASNESDKDELIQFIDDITSKNSSTIKKSHGIRTMIDLRQVYLSYYYHPLAKGSNSIKDVLPAILNTSESLKNKYSQPLASIGITSLNFGDQHRWLKLDGEKIINPYKLLPPIFEEYSDQEVEEFLSEMENIAGGGAALTAYAKLQYWDMSINERTAIRNALLKYCELDTLAMAMIIEEFQAQIRD